MANIIRNSVIKQSNREGEARTITQINDELWINGEKIDAPKSLFFKNCFVQYNGKNYVNGKKWIASRDGKAGAWKYTFKSLWHTIF